MNISFDNNLIQSHLKKDPPKPVNEILNSDKLNYTCLIDFLNKSKFIDNTQFSETNVYKDLEIFKGLDNIETSLVNKLNQTKTVFGYLKFISTLNTVESDPQKISNKQNQIKKLCEVMEGNDKYDVESSLKTLAEYQKDIIWMIKPKTVEEQSILKSVYFSGFLNNLNNYEEPLNIYSYFKIYLAPLYGLLSPLVMMVFPFLYLKFFSKVKINFGVYLKILKMSIFGDVFSVLGSQGSGRSKLSKYFSLFLSIIFYIQNVFNNIKISMNTSKIINLINKKLGNVKKFCDTSVKLINNLSEKLDFSKIEFPIKYLNNYNFSNENSIFSNKGKVNN